MQENKQEKTHWMKSLGRAIIIILMIAALLFLLNFIAGQTVDILSGLNNFMKHPGY